MRTLLLLCLSVSLSAFADVASDAPVSLTASDGTGLKLVKLQARGVVSDPLAFTELTMTFENPLDRVLEGQFKVTLPVGATVSRFAMKIEGKWQEGEVVERQAARRAYEDFLHRRQDPALLEQSGGNEFTAKVFPIPAKGTKEVVISYSHDLVQKNSTYVLPLKGLPEVGSLDVKVSGVDGDGVLNKTRFVPNADFVGVPKRNALGVRSGDLVAARIVPVDATDSDVLANFTLLVDSSGSRALGWKEQTQLVQKLLASLPGATVNVIAFDQEVASIYSGPTSGFGDAQVKTLRDRRALGASNVELALKTVLAKPTPRVVVLADGVFTAGVTEGPNLTALVLKLKAAGVKRIDGIAVGGLRDEAALTQITVGSLERDGSVLDGSLAAPELARRLGLATRSKLEVKVDGATAVWPRVVNGIQAGDAVLVYAQLPASAPFKGTIGGKPMAVGDGQLASTKSADGSAGGIERPLLERAWAKARIDSLQDELQKADGAPQRDAIKKEMIGVSISNRVLCSLTALLVLETEADYARFNIDRKALADILTVDNGQVKRTKRAADSIYLARVEVPPAPREPASPKKPKPSPDKAEKKEEAKAKDMAPMKKSKAKMDESDADGVSDKLAEKESEPETKPVPSEAPRADPAPSRPAPAPAPPPPPPPATQAPRAEAESERRNLNGGGSPLQKGSDPYTGKFKEVMVALETDKKKGVALASGWHEEQPGDILALVALGTALEAAGDSATAARAYGSIIDLFPARADLRRFAGVRLESIVAALELAIDTFAKAAEQRADHPQSHRLLAYSLLRAGKPEKAFEAIARGIAQQYPGGRFAGVDRILREDAGLIAAAWIKAEPSRKGEIEGKLKSAGGWPETEPSARFVLNWETDANDVDFHITDSKGGHAYYSSKVLPSGGELYADVTTGYGPECFTIRLPKGRRAGPYTLQAHYYSIGPMGAGMGKLEIVEHDGKGGLTFEQRPYVVMVNQAYVDLGVVK